MIHSLVQRLRGYFRFLRAMVCLPVAYVIPRDVHLAVFGAWGGNNYSDNPKYFMRWLREHTDIRCVWIGRPHIRNRLNGEFVEQGSWKALWLCLRASLFVCNINCMDDIMDVPLRGRVFLYNAWHGIPLKKIGQHQFSKGVRMPHSLWERMMECLHCRLARQQAWTSVSSPGMGKIMEEAWPKWFAPSRILYAGLPRNDFLIQNRGNEDFRRVLKERYARLLGLPADKQWFLYLPTFRHNSKAFTFSECPKEQGLDEILRAHHAVLVEKQHPRVVEQIVKGGNPQNAQCVFLLSGHQAQEVDVQELLLIADRLITDYSSCYFDFALTGRPVLHFAYDYEVYRSQDTGAYYDLAEVCAGPVCPTLQALLDWLAKPDVAFQGTQGRRFGELVACEHGNASESVYRAYCKALGLGEEERQRG